MNQISLSSLEQLQNARTIRQLQLSTYIVFCIHALYPTLIAKAAKGLKKGTTEMIFKPPSFILSEIKATASRIRMGKIKAESHLRGLRIVLKRMPC